METHQNKQTNISDDFEKQSNPSSSSSYSPMSRGGDNKGVMEREEEVAGGGLERRRRMNKMGRQENGTRNVEVEKERPAANAGSVYLDGDEGEWKCRHCIWTFQLSGPGIDHIQKHEGYCQVVMDTETSPQLGTYFYSSVKGIPSPDEIAGVKISEVNYIIDDKKKSLVNGKTDFRTKELNNLENVLVSEEIQNHISKKVILQNGVSSNLSSKDYNENETARSELEIEENDTASSGLEIEENGIAIELISEDELVKLVKKSELEVAELDIEKVLDEQNTHDLYCPNCNSCITKRVILRKRKRTVRQIQYEAPPAKLQQLQHNFDSTIDSAERTDLDHDREPDIFRCLSCFSFFVPTDAGFNIFRIFGRRGETENLQTSQQLPAKNLNSSSSTFRPVVSTTGASKSDLPLASESTIASIQQMGETSSAIHTSTAATTLGAVSLGESKETTGKNDTESGFNIFRIFGRRQVTENSQQIPAKDLNQHSSIFKPEGSTTTASESGLSLPSESNNTTVQYMHETTTSISVSSVTTALGAVSLGETQVTTTRHDTESHNLFSGDSYYEEKKSSTTSTVSGATELQEDQTTVWEKDAESHNIFGGDSYFEEKKSSMTITVSGATEHHDGQSIVGEKDADSMTWGSLITDGEQVDGPFKSNMQSFLAKTESEGDKFKKGPTFTRESDGGDDVIRPISIIKPSVPERISEVSQIDGSVPPETVVSTRVETQIYMGEPSAREAGRRNDWDVLKSIVYGGLVESVTSLGVVSSAAGSDASTLNIVALGLANLIGGLFVIAHDLSDLHREQEKTFKKNGEPVGRYWELLGRKANFRLHATIAFLTYIVVGLLPPVIYGFSFRISDNKEYKLIVVAAASFLCISLLAIGKAHVGPQKAYIKTLAYYLALGISASGLSYVAGVMIHRLLEQLGLFDNIATAPAPPSDMYHDITSTLGAWASS